jgi:phenylalanyl-tRNA synthetase beta chain
MPTIDISVSDLQKLVGKDLSLDEIKRRIELVKGEVKRGSTETELRVELQDTNRPDTWCVEGVARQIRQRLAQPPRPWKVDYKFLEDPGPAEHKIEVDASVEAVRPFIAGFRATGWKVDDHGLRAFIQAQETLSNNFGRKRVTVSIGIYDASRIEWPVRYKAVALDDREAAFEPLPPAVSDPAAPWRPGKRTPAEILRDHPTGREFAHALKGSKLAPLLQDARGETLSFPPIINSATLGRVTVGMSDLFVEVTGDPLDHVLLAANILAANLADRGAKIGPVEALYPYGTPRGRAITAPNWLPEKRILRVPVARFRGLLGEPKLEDKEILDALASFGLEVGEKERKILVEAAPYRMDYLHEVDAVEDFAISRGFEAFVPLMPQEFSVGRIAPATEFADKARDRMIGYGFEEAISNILTEEAHLRAAMNLPETTRSLPLLGERVVKIANVMNANYSSLRDWVLPSLLEAESRSAGAVYPHRIFEAGEVAVSDAGAPMGSRTEQRLAALIAHETASFSEAQAFLNLLLRHLGLGSPGKPTYALAALDHPSFIPGRAVAVTLGGRNEPVGVLGELHPEVLAGNRGWSVRVPCAGFEVSLDALRAALGG